VADATSDILYRSDPINGKDKGINVSKNTSYVDSTVKNKVMYTYSVVAVRVVDDKPYYSEESTANPVQIAVYVDSVGNLKATGSDGAITLTWDPVNKADGYIIRYTTPYGSGFEDLDRIKSSPFVHSGLLNKTSYKYSVTAYRIVNGEMVESEQSALPVVGTAGTPLAAPADFKVVPGDGQNTLSWSKVNDADGYAVYVVDSSGSGYRLIDRVSKTTAIHTNIPNGTTVTYRVCAFKMVNGQTEEGDFTNNITVTTGVYLGSPTDVVATAGDASVTIKWKKVDGAEGYVVYSYEGNSTSFTPVGIVTSPSFTHTGLTNGRTYTYMICAYKTIEGKPQYSGYSLSVSAIPMGKDTENNNKPEEPAEYRIYITGTTPYGMSNSNLISAFANKGAITNDIDVRFTLNGEDVEAIQRVLNYYGEGVESFMIYPMNISLYKAGTDEKIQLENGYTMTLTIPVPDELLHVSEYITVIHVSENDQLEILPSTHVSVNGVDCMQFTAASFSPFAFVVYLSQITDDSIFGEGEDVSTGAFASANGSVEIQVSQTAVLRCTYLPQIYRRRARNKVYRVIKHKR
ncbi:MAG: fibronectin type III domain-containing protein, partial [Huintestinicola sp.]